MQVITRIALVLALLVSGAAYAPVLAQGQTPPAPTAPEGKKLQPGAIILTDNGGTQTHATVVDSGLLIEFENDDGTVTWY